jgi:mRNA-degrading endonuclease RelE of RelBE toxin-antitoxin system
VANYSLEINPTAQKELDALGDPLCTCIDRKILALADNPSAVKCKKLNDYRLKPVGWARD